jgi:acyl-CoA thioesterase
VEERELSQQTELTEQQRIMDRARAIVESSEFCREVGIELELCEKDHAIGRIRLSRKHSNPLGDVHGGVLFALADTICGVAAASRGNGGPTVSGYMDYLRPVHCEVLYCSAHVVKHGHNLIRSECVLTDEHGKELVKGYFVFLATTQYRDFSSSGRPDTVHK